MPHPLRLCLVRLVRPALVLAVMSSACLKVPTDGLDEPTSQTGAPTTAQAVLDRYIEALGGEAALRKINQRTVEARMTFLPETGCPPDDETCRLDEKIGSFLLQTTADNRLYRRTTIEKQIDEQGYDGATGWQLRGGMLVLEDAEEAAISREDANLHWYFDYAKRGIEISLEPARDRDHDDKQVTLDGVRWKYQNGLMQDKVLWFDRATGLLHEELLEDTSDNQVLRQWILYDEYRPVDGVQVAHKIRLINQVDDRAQEVVFTTQRVDHQQIADDPFVVPTLPPPKRVPDPLLRELDRARDAAAAAPKDRDAALEWSRAAWAAGHFDEAAKAATTTLKLDPNEAEALWILARQQVLLGKFKEAQASLIRAEKAGVRPQLVAAQQAWIHSHQRNFDGVAEALDKLGPENAALAGRYRMFVGKPLEISMAGNNCQVDLPISADGNNAVIDVEIHGEKVRAMIDTGASDIIVDVNLAKKLQLPVRSRTPVRDQGEIGHTQIDELKLGPLTVRNVPVDIFPSETLAQMSGERDPVAAVLGVRVLSQFLVTYDLPARQVSFVTPGPRCKAALAAHRRGDATPMWLHETHFVYVLGEMNDAEGLFLINTGMKGVDMTATSRAFAHAGIGAPPLRRDEPTLVDIPKFTIGEILRADKLRGAYGYFEQNESSDQFRIDGMIGLDVLTRRRVTLDFPERKLYFSDSTAPATPAAKPAAKPGAAP